MGTATMGKVFVSAKIENLEDLYAVHQGILTPDKVHFRSLWMTRAGRYRGHRADDPDAVTPRPLSASHATTTGTECEWGIPDADV